MAVLLFPAFQKSLFSLQKNLFVVSITMMVSIHDSKGLTQLRVGLSKLNYHYFTQDLRNTTNRICPKHNAMKAVALPFSAMKRNFSLEHVLYWTTWSYNLANEHHMVTTNKGPWKDTQCIKIVFLSPGGLT